MHGTNHRRGPGRVAGARPPPPQPTNAAQAASPPLRPTVGSLSAASALRQEAGHGGATARRSQSPWHTRRRCSDDRAASAARAPSKFSRTLPSRHGHPGWGQEPAPRLMWTGCHTSSRDMRKPDSRGSRGPWSWGLNSARRARMTQPGRPRQAHVATGGVRAEGRQQGAFQCTCLGAMLARRPRAGAAARTPPSPWHLPWEWPPVSRALPGPHHGSESSPAAQNARPHEARGLLPGQSHAPCMATRCDTCCRGRWPAALSDRDRVLGHPGLSPPGRRGAPARPPP